MKVSGGTSRKRTKTEDSAGKVKEKKMVGDVQG
jgi:hypothetical protein